MSKRYWDGIFAVGLVLGFSIAVNVLVWLSVGWDWIDSEITNADPSGYASNKCSEQQTENAAVNSTALKDKQAVSADVGSPEANGTQSNQPDWCDLAAQQSMAYSTVRLKHAAWLTALFTLGGVLLLWRTLFLTRRTLDEAKKTVEVTREIGEAQVRAYLSAIDFDIEVRDPEIGDWYGGPDTPNFAVEVRFKLMNTGNSPAYFAHIEYGVGTIIKNATARLGDIVSFRETEPSTILIPANSSDVIMTLKGAMIADLEKVKSGEHEVLICIAFKYLDVFKKWKKTPPIVGTFSVPDVGTEKFMIGWKSLMPKADQDTREQ